MIFQYWSNKDGYHIEILFICVADTISEADQQFQDATNMNPRSISWIGCVLLSIANFYQHQKDINSHD